MSKDVLHQYAWICDLILWPLQSQIFCLCNWEISRRRNSVKLRIDKDSSWRHLKATMSKCGSDYPTHRRIPMYLYLFEFWSESEVCSRKIKVLQDFWSKKKLALPNVMLKVKRMQDRSMISSITLCTKLLRTKGTILYILRQQIFGPYPPTLSA